MKKKSTYWLAGVVFGIICFIPVGTLHAQAPAGPISGAPSQDAPKPEAQHIAVQAKNIFGAWKLNPDESDDPRKKMQQARGGGNGSGGNGGGNGGGRMGGGYGRGRMARRGVSDEERQRMQELFRPANRLTIASKDAEIDLTDDQNRKRTFFTDGRKIKKSKDIGYEEIAAHWEDKRLVTDEKTPRGEKMSRTYELSYDGTQMYETLHMTVGRSETPLVIRYVYEPDQKGSGSAGN